jgi:hypothetical protein
VTPHVHDYRTLTASNVIQSVVAVVHTVVLLAVLSPFVFAIGIVLPIHTHTLAAAAAGTARERSSR